MRAPPPAAARRELQVFYELAATAGTPEVVRLAKTIKRWEPQVLNFFTTRRTNARSEAQNLVTEKLRRVAHGMRNFEHYRLRLLLHSGVEWDTRPTARIRGRHPRLSRVEPLIWRASPVSKGPGPTRSGSWLIAVSESIGPRVVSASTDS